jgi:uncharacterized ion transporter superfamily protein YfcC
MVNICDAHYCFLLRHPYSLIVDDDMIVATLIVFMMTTISDIDGAVVVAVSLSLNRLCHLLEVLSHKNPDE